MVNQILFQRRELFQYHFECKIFKHKISTIKIKVRFCFYNRNLLNLFINLCTQCYQIRVFVPEVFLTYFAYLSITNLLSNSPRENFNGEEKIIIELMNLLPRILFCVCSVYYVQRRKREENYFLFLLSKTF